MDWLDTTDQFFAGFGDAITFGGTTWIRTHVYGDVATQNHQGTAFHVGQGAGMATGMALGVGAGGSAAKAGQAAFRASRATGAARAAAAARAGRAANAVRAAQAYTVAGDAHAAYTSTRNLVCGCFKWHDTFGFAPVIGCAAGRFSQWLKHVDDVVPDRNLDDLFRAVSDAELDDIAEAGFRQGPNAMETKLFATSAEDAGTYARDVLFPIDGQPLTVVQAVTPTNIVSQMDSVVTDGMPTMGLPPELMDEFNESVVIIVMDSIPIPQ